MKNAQVGDYIKFDNKIRKVIEVNEYGLLGKHEYMMSDCNWLVDDDFDLEDVLLESEVEL